MITIYFSGTGNTKFIAKSFSKLTKTPYYSIEDDENFKKLIEDNNTIALCYPIHFSTAPIIFLDFLKKYKKYFAGKKIIILCSQQFFSGDGARRITDILTNVTVIYAEHFNMQNNITCFPTYYKITKVNNKKCLQKTYNKVKKVAFKISKGEIKLQGFNKFSKALGQLQLLSPDDIAKKQKVAVAINNNCVSCNKCVKLCPSKNLINHFNKITSKKNCTFCMRCVNICPKKAITVLLHGNVKEQYYIADKF